MTNFSVGSASDTGRARTVNQDRFFVSTSAFAVADGMGGHRGGEVASTVALSALEDAVAGASSVDGFKQAVQDANAAVFAEADADPELRGMGTTLTMLAELADSPDDVVLLNVGDSRIYRIGADGLEQLTEDHSLVEVLVREGRLTAEEALTHPQRNIVTRALGVEAFVEVDATVVHAAAGDRFLLCSDGLFNELTDAQIAATLRRLDDPDDAADELVRLANDAGGRDNITCVVVDIGDRGGESAKSTATAAQPVVASKRHVKAADDVADAPVASTRSTWRTMLFLAAMVVLAAIVVIALLTLGDDGGSTPALLRQW